MIANHILAVSAVGDIWQYFVAFCASTITVSTALGIVLKVVLKIKAPIVSLEARIDAQEAKLNEHEAYLKQIDSKIASDHIAIEAINESNRVTQTSLLAIMEQLLTGDSLDALKKAKDSLNAYLVNK